MTRCPGPYLHIHGYDYTTYFLMQLYEDGQRRMLAAQDQHDAQAMSEYVKDEGWNWRWN